MKRSLSCGMLSWVVLTAVGCASREPTALPGDIEFAQSSSAARAAFDRGDSKLAAVLYERAGARARLIAEAQSVADADFNQAWCETELGDFGRADELLREAGYEAARSGDGGTDIQLLRCRLALLRGNVDEAVQRLNELLKNASVPAAYEPRVLVLQGKIQLAQHDIAAADVTLGQILQNGLSPLTRADVEELRGEIAVANHRWLNGAKAFDAQADLLRGIHRYRAMALAISRAAAAYESAGDNQLAADRYWRAARSLKEQEDNAAARRFIDAADRCAKLADNRELMKLISREQNGSKDSHTALP